MAIKINNTTVIDDNRVGTFQVLNAGTGTTPPDGTGVEVGDFFYSTDSETLVVWTGSEWK